MPSNDDQPDVAFTRALATSLRAAKERSPYSIRSLAAQAGVGTSTVQRYLNGSREIPVPALRRMARLLGTTAGALMDEAEQSLRH